MISFMFLNMYSEMKHFLLSHNKDTAADLHVIWQNAGGGRTKRKVKAKAFFPAVPPWNMNLSMNEDYRIFLFFYLRGTAFHVLLFTSICCNWCKVAKACFVANHCFKMCSADNVSLTLTSSNKWKWPIPISISPMSHLVFLKIDTTYSKYIPTVQCGLYTRACCDTFWHCMCCYQKLIVNERKTMSFGTNTFKVYTGALMAYESGN